MSRAWAGDANPAIPGIFQAMRAKLLLLTALVAASASSWTHLGSGRLTAQTATRLLDETLAPRGYLRLGALPSFTSWDSRYGLKIEDGVETRAVESLGEVLIDERGAIFPGFTDMENHIRALIDDPDFLGSAGSSDAALHQDITRVDIGAHYGVFDWLTVGVNLPLVKTRMAFENSLWTGEDANLGVNPLLQNAGEVARLLDGLAAATAAAGNYATGRCSSDPGSNVCRDAQALSARIASFESSARGAYTSSFVFPMEGTAVADSLAAALARLEADLAVAGVRNLPSMVFATDWFTASAITELPSQTFIGAEPIAPIDGEWKLGDVEASLLARVLEGTTGDPTAPTAAYHVTAGITGRFGTGAPDAPDRLFDLGTGDGQIDIEARVVGAFRWRSFAGVRIGARYGVQQPLVRELRIASPDDIFAPLSTLRSATWHPGSYLGVDAEPAWTVTDELSVVGAYRLFAKSRDRFVLDVAESGAPDPAALELESGATWHRAGLGIRYSTTDPLGARMSSPFEVNIRWLFPVAGSGGQVPVASSLEVGIRLFRRM